MVVWFTPGAWRANSDPQTRSGKLPFFLTSTLLAPWSGLFLLFLFGGRFQLLPDGQGLLSLLLVQQVDGEPRVHDDVLPHLGLRDVFQTRHVHRAGVVNPTHLEPVVLEDLQDFPGDGQTHSPPLGSGVLSSSRSGRLAP